MSDIPIELFRRIKVALLNCGPVESYDHLQAVFADPRLRPWQNSIPRASAPIAQVNAVMAYLSDRRHANSGENVLALLLCVLSEQIDPGDECHQRLAELAEALERVENGEDGEVRGDELPPPPELVSEIKNLVKDDRLTEALAMLSEVKAYRDEVTLLTRRLNSIHRRERQGIATPPAIDVERTKIAKVILEIVSSRRQR
jgi:hypothetical protein